MTTPAKTRESDKVRRRDVWKLMCVVLIVLAILPLVFTTGCTTFEAVYWCAKAPPGPGICPP